MRFVLIVAMGARLYGFPRMTADADIAPARDAENLERPADALHELNARVYSESVPEGLPFDVSAKALDRANLWNLVTDGGQKIHKAEKVEFFAMDRDLFESLAGHLDRRTAWAPSVTDGQIYMDVGGASYTGTVERLAAHHKTGGSIQSHAGLDIEFHALVARISGNRALMLAREPINLLYRPSLIQLQQALPQMERRNLDAHRRIVKTIIAGDAELAHEWMRKHLIDFQRGYAVAGIPMNTPLQMHQLQ